MAESNQKIEEDKKFIISLSNRDYTSLSEEEKAKAEEIKKQQDALEFEDELMKQWFLMDYNRANPVSFEEYKKNKSNE